MSPHHPSHTQQRLHVDHNHIMKRLNEYTKVYSTGNAEAMMQFYHPDKFVYSDFSANREGMGHDEVMEQYKHTFNDSHDLEIRRLSVHGHKDFTAWEWEIPCKPALEQGTGKRLSKDEAPPKKLVDCTLMWWKEDNIIRNHDYVQMKEV